jgi:hypothetical protein
VQPMHEAEDAEDPQHRMLGERRNDLPAQSHRDSSSLAGRGDDPERTVRSAHSFIVLRCMRLAADPISYPNDYAQHSSTPRGRTQEWSVSCVENVTHLRRIHC